MQLYKEFSFDSAHFLPNVPPDHKCAHMHGHTYYVRILLEGPLDPQLGWVVDFADVKEAWTALEKILDHKLLNDIPGLENPTAEVIAIWIWDRIKPQFPLLKSIEVKETPTSGVIYTGE